MKEHMSWVGHHDFVGDPILRSESRHTRSLLEAKLERDLSHFRARVVSKLANDGILKEGRGAGVYALDYNEGGGGLALDQGMQETLISIRPVLSLPHQLPMPHIRIITNELYEATDAPTWLSIDFMATPEGAIRHFIDAYSFTSHREGRTLASFFCIDEDGDFALSTSTPGMTPEYVISAPEIQPPVVPPFGSGTVLEDKIHALEVGNQLLADVYHLTPAYYLNPLGELWPF